MKRIIVGVIAAFVALFLAATLAPAQAAPADMGYDVRTGTAERAAAAAKPMRHVGIKSRKTIDGKLFAFGHIGPNKSYKLSKVLIRKGHCKPVATGGVRCWGFKGNVYKTVKTNNVGNYSLRIRIPADCKWHWFDAVVPARGKYGFSRSKGVVSFKRCRG